MKTVEKNESEKLLLREMINKSFLFKAMDDKSIEIIINAMESKSVSANENIITQGEKGYTLYLLVAGEAEVYRTDVMIIIIKNKVWGLRVKIQKKFTTRRYIR